MSHKHRCQGGTIYSRQHKCTQRTNNKAPYFLNIKKTVRMRLLRWHHAKKKFRRNLPHKTRNRERKIAPPIFLCALWLFNYPHFYKISRFFDANVQIFAPHLTLVKVNFCDGANRICPSEKKDGIPPKWNAKINRCWVFRFDRLHTKVEPYEEQSGATYGLVFNEISAIYLVGSVYLTYQRFLYWSSRVKNFSEIEGKIEK